MLRPLITAIAIPPLTVIFGILTFLGGLVSRKKLPTLTMRAWAKSILAVAGVRVSRTGLENIDPDRAAIYMANHASMIDIPILLAWLPVDLRFIFKQSLLYIPLVGQVIYLVGMVPIDRASRARATLSLKKAARQIKKGKHILIFPEGTRSRGGGLLPFKKGGFYLAIQESIDILPISIWDSQALCGRNSIWAKSGHIDLAVHPRIATAPFNLERRDLLIEQVRESISSGLKPRTAAKPAKTSGVA